MKPTINLYCENNSTIKEFLNKYYSNFILENNTCIYTKEYENPIDMIDLISCLVDNKDVYNIGIWISLDENIYICITENNLNNFIKYLYERYPY